MKFMLLALIERESNMKNRFLAKSVKLSALMALFVATGCTEYHRLLLKDTMPMGPEFTRTLAEEYETLGNTEQAIMYDDWSANWYFCKAILAKQGRIVIPTPLCKWDIESDKIPELAIARERLMRALESGAWQIAPKMSAHAQAHFDCWVEQQAEGWQKEDIANCRAEFYHAMAEVELMLRGGVLETMPANMVFFDFGSTHINAEAAGVIDRVASVKDSPAGYPGHILLIGRTDKIGDAENNMELSEKRAQMVKKELVRRGVSPHHISTKAAGEAPGPKVEGHNRRVDILFLEY